MIDHRGRAETPDEIAVELRAIDGHLTFGIAAQAFAARGFAAAVAITHDVVAVVAGIVARPHPRGRRGRRAGRTVMRVAAAARAEESIGGGVLPVIAGGI